MRLGTILTGIAVTGFTAATVRAAEVRPSPAAAPAAACVSQSPQPGEGARCMVDDRGTSLGFRSTQAVALGTIETFATFSGQADNAFTPDRLTASDARAVGQANRAMIGGVKARLLDDRLTLTTQFGWSDYVDRSAPRAEILTGRAQRLRVDLKLADTTALRWAVAGEMSDVSDNFFLGQVDGEGAMLTLPGQRLALSSALRWQRLRLTAGHDDYRGRFGAFATTRVGIARNGTTLSLKSTAGTLGAADGAARFAARTATRSVTLEVDLASLAPALAMDARFPAMLAPKHLLVSWRGGTSESAFATGTERFERSGIELYGTWETPAGETSLGYWRDRRVGAAAALGRRDEQIVQLSHLIRAGDWRFGIDAMVADSRSTRGAGLADRTVAIGGSVAYEVADGPRLMIQLSDDRGRMAADDHSFLTARRGQQVSASLDLTQMLRRRFDRPDLRLRIDYRKQLDRSTTEVSALQQLVDRWTDGRSGEGLLISFGMKL